MTPSRADKGSPWEPMTKRMRGWWLSVEVSLLAVFLVAGVVDLIWHRPPPQIARLPEAVSYVWDVSYAVGCALALYGIFRAGGRPRLEMAGIFVFVFGFVIQAIALVSFDADWRDVLIGIVFFSCLSLGLLLRALWIIKAPPYRIVILTTSSSSSSDAEAEAGKT